MSNDPQIDLPDNLRSALKRLKEGHFNQIDISLVQEAKSSGSITIASNGAVAIGGDAIGNVIVTLTADAMKILFPPPPIPHQVSPPPLDFKGREMEIKDILLGFNQGATITGFRGLGGIGKTALALVLAEKLKDHYSDGQIFVDMRGTSKTPLAPAEAMAKVIHAYHPDISLTEDLNETKKLYLSYLSGKSVLILLDNASDGNQVEPLVPPSSCAIIVTSRQKFTLPGMKPMDLDTLPPEDSRDLLLTICQRIDGHADELARLCGYLPLALRNAASMLAERIDLEVPKYCQRLKDATACLDLVDASFGLSYDLLPEDKRRLWSILSVFPADFDRAGAIAVLGMDEDPAAEILSELVKWSIVGYVPPPSEDSSFSGRYRLHDLARNFAASQLDSIEKAAARARHAEYYQNVLADANDQYFQGGDRILAGLQLFDMEWPNIRAGQSWAKNTMISKDGEKGAEEKSALRLASTYPHAGAYILDIRLQPHEKIRWFETGIVAARLLKDRGTEGAHLSRLGNAYWNLGKYRKAIKFHKKHLAIARKIGDRKGESTALGNLGNAYKDLGEYRKSIEFYERVLAIIKEFGDRRIEGYALGNLGLAYWNLGEHHKAIELHKKHLAIARKIGDRRGESCALGNLGLAYDSLGDHRKAIKFHKKALVIDKEIGDRRGEGQDLGNLGLAYGSLGDYNKAIEFHEKDLAIAKDLSDRGREWYSLGNLGNAYKDLGEYRKAIEFHEKHLAISREIKNQDAEGQALFNMSLALDMIGDRAQAITRAKLALHIYEQIESTNIEEVRQKLEEWQS